MEVHKKNKIYILRMFVYFSVTAAECGEGVCGVLIIDRPEHDIDTAATERWVTFLLTDQDRWYINIFYCKHPNEKSLSCE